MTTRFPNRPQALPPASARAPGRRTALRLAGASLVALMLTSCGGSISLGFGSGFRNPPTVALTASRTSVPVGESTVLAAAATDQIGVDRVEFFRLEGNVSQRLATATQVPYQLEVIFNSVGPQVFFARAYNFDGRFSDSSTVTVSGVNP